jgi:hypothetical protein
MHRSPISPSIPSHPITHICIPRGATSGPEAWGGIGECVIPRLGSSSASDLPAKGLASTGGMFSPASRSWHWHWGGARAYHVPIYMFTYLLFVGSQAPPPTTSPSPTGLVHLSLY